MDILFYYLFSPVFSKFIAFSFQIKCQLRKSLFLKSYALFLGIQSRFINCIFMSGSKRDIAKEPWK